MSAVVVVVGIIWSVGGYLSNRGTDVAGLFAAGAIWFGGIALALIWLGVFLGYVIRQGIRVLGDS
jgi:hypothetical protein